MPRRVLLLSVFALVAGCANGPRVEVSPAEVPLPLQHVSGAELAQPRRADGTPVVLSRALVRQAVQAGIGRFLAGVELSAVLQNGRFVGFRLDRAHALPQWNASGLAVRHGDVVTRINSAPIERPEQAQAVFARLVDADAIVLDIVRDGAAMTLRVPIAADPPTLTDTSVRGTAAALNGR